MEGIAAALGATADFYVDTCRPFASSGAPARGPIDIGFTARACGRQTLEDEDTCAPQLHLDRG